MIVEKTFTIDAPISKVWATIIDPEQVAHCIPGCESVKKIDDDNYKAVVKVAIGPIKTSFNIDICCTEQRPPEFATYVTNGDEGGKASRVKATSNLRLKSLSDTQTEVSYSSDINIVGRLGKFGSGMVLKVADSMGDDFVLGLKNVISSEGLSPPLQNKTLNAISRAFWAGAIVALAAIIYGLLQLI